MQKKKKSIVPILTQVRPTATVKNNHRHDFVLKRRFRGWRG